MSRSRDIADQINRVDSSAANSTAITIDSSENVLVGTTGTDPNNATSSSDAGTAIRSDGRFLTGVYQDFTADFNRIGNDGEIVRLSKDGATVGSIGAQTRTGNTELGIGTGDTGLNFFDQGDAICPVNMANGFDRNGAIDLGRNGVAFKDLHLSGGVVFGTGGPSPITSNTLDDYEEGTWTPTLPTSGLTFSGSTSGTYVKVGRTVHLTFNLNCTSIGGTTSGNFAVSGIPFNAEAVSPWAAGAYTGDKLNFSRTVHKAFTRLSDNSFGFLSSNNADTWAWESHQILTSGSDIRASITYITNA